MEKQALIIFLKYPEHGKVKTRLAKKVGKDFALELYKNFIKDLFEKTKQVSADIFICYTMEKESPLNDFFWQTSYKYFKQTGIDLGERMYNAFLHIFNNKYENCVLMGSDFPDLPVNYIKSAFDELNKNDVVLGPCYDGGYYLIGLTNSSIDNQYFKNINWSTSTVLTETLEKIDDKNKKYSLLQKWNDIDELSDLEELMNKSISDKSLHTYKFLNKNREKLYEKL